MHGLGNDFVILNALERRISLNPEQIRHIADRRLGIGCDQVLMIRPSRVAQADFHYRIFNADGSEAEHCGNGIRCLARLLRDKGLLDKPELVADTDAGAVKAYFEEGACIRVNMGVPRFRPADIPISSGEMKPRYQLKLEEMSVEVIALSIGNPHAVLLVEDTDETPVARIGRQIQAHGLFPQGVNVGFMQIVDGSHVRLRVFERGVGETRACGTGACAAVVAGIGQYDLHKDVDVALKGGHLKVSWEGEGAPVWMTGPATTVYKGQIEI